MTSEPNPGALSSETLRAAFAALAHPRRTLSPYDEAMAAWASLQPPDEFQRLVEQSVFAGEHVHTWRGGELRCVMGECD